MKNKGFTLIELLAVIVILAIIALIATPIILGIINDARESAKKRSAELVYTGVEYAITTYMYGHEGAVPTTKEQIVAGFDAENVEWKTTGDDANKFVTDDGVKCTLDKGTEGWVVDCGTYLTKTIKVATN